MLVEQRLAACAQVSGPIHSIYRWQGAVEESDEHMLILKCSAAALDAAMTEISNGHPYENPEIVAMAIDTGSTAYLDWVVAESGAAP